MSHRLNRTVKISAVLLALSISAPAFALTHKVEKAFKGLASFYADKFDGHKTASGAPYDDDAFTCAHRSLPFGTRLLVKNEETGSCCVVVVNDRGPFRHNRVVDLSKAAARKLGIRGVGKVICYTGKEVGDVVASAAKKADSLGHKHDLFKIASGKNKPFAGKQNLIVDAE